MVGDRDREPNDRGYPHRKPPFSPESVGDERRGHGHENVNEGGEEPSGRLPVRKDVLHQWERDHATRLEQREERDDDSEDLAALGAGVS